MKVIQVILGLVVFVLLNVYQWLPLLGVLLVIGSVVGFVSGSDIAGRSLLLGTILLAIRYVIALSFQWILNRSSKSNDPYTPVHSSSNNPSKLPVEITEDDRRQYEIEEREYLRRYADDSSYSFKEEKIR